MRSQVVVDCFSVAISVALSSSDSFSIRPLILPIAQTHKKSSAVALAVHQPSFATFPGRAYADLFHNDSCARWPKMDRDRGEAPILFD